LMCVCGVWLQFHSKTGHVAQSGKCGWPDDIFILPILVDPKLFSILAPCVCGMWLQFHSKTGHVALVNVAGHTGAWLALLRPATNGVTRNTLVYMEGEKHLNVCTMIRGWERAGL
jgi:hypothetical protein